MSDNHNEQLQNITNSLNNLQLHRESETTRSDSCIAEINTLKAELHTLNQRFLFLQQQFANMPTPPSAPTPVYQDIGVMTHASFSGNPKELGRFLYFVRDRLVEAGHRFPSEKRTGFTFPAYRLLCIKAKICQRCHNDYDKAHITSRSCPNKEVMIKEKVAKFVSLSQNPQVAEIDMSAINFNIQPQSWDNLVDATGGGNFADMLMFGNDEYGFPVEQVSPSRLIIPVRLLTSGELGLLPRPWWTLAREDRVSTDHQLHPATSPTHGMVE
ncbi:hypothetical protein H4Q26_017785 [Puccinia striiformis f. sp. tritici PST-130]|nr:hypothetical protein H4Q26_017785 [Puccinia striiformis f. sp. tritici PST-130]